MNSCPMMKNSQEIESAALLYRDDGRRIVFWFAWNRTEDTVSCMEQLHWSKWQESYLVYLSGSDRWGHNFWTGLMTGLMAAAHHVKTTSFKMKIIGTMSWDFGIFFGLRNYVVLSDIFREHLCESANITRTKEKGGRNIYENILYKVGYIFTE